ncbi:MAG TPA: flagellar motor protein MotB [Steroidobacteraceae bacterium]|nr:flagellar motor protein MotB [Steroidobacteraceae bacterium]
MARRRRHEEHENHERWAIPYGDLVTLLLAFFVVMYSISQVNDGKYRVLSDSLNAAFRGEPTTVSPIQVGSQAATTVAAPVVQLAEQQKLMALRQLQQQTEKAMAPLIMQGLVDVSNADGKLSIAIRSDILFTSGAAAVSGQAEQVIHLLGQVLGRFPVDVRVEGHTDNVPLEGGPYRSNWELSAARSVSVLQQLIAAGVPPERLSAVGYGEFHPVAPNTTPDGRNVNRRVVLSVESAAAAAPATPASGGGAG